MAQTKKYTPSWDLDSIFIRGNQSESLRETISELTKEIERTEERIEHFDSENASAVELAIITERLAPVQKQLRDVFAYISCLSAQDVHDEAAAVWVAKRGELNAKMGATGTKFDQKLKEIDDTMWDQLMQSPELQEIAFPLSEARHQVKELLPLDQEILINDLAVDGYHAWNQMYDTIVGNMTVTEEENGETKHYSMGQASNKMSSSDRSVRKKCTIKPSKNGRKMPRYSDKR